MGDNSVGDTSDLLELPQDMGLARRGSSWRVRLECFGDAHALKTLHFAGVVLDAP